MEFEDLGGQADKYQPGLHKDIVGELGSGPPSQYRWESYYHLPALKPSYYGWKTGTSFFSVGMGGFSQILAAIIDLSGKEKDRSLVRAGRYLAFTGSLISSSLFIVDLHRPGRWYNMMRILRRTSWMSIGSWCLVSFGALSGLIAVAQLMEDAGFKRLGRWMARFFQVPAAAAGGVLCFYSGAELEATSIPLWKRSFPLLPALFGAANASSAASAMLLLTKNSKPSRRRWRQLEKFWLLSGAVEEILYRFVSSRWKKGPREGLSQPPAVRVGTITFFVRMIRMMKILLALQNRTLSLLLAPVSGLLLPVQVLLAGNESSRRPGEYFSDTQPVAFSKDPGAGAISRDRKNRMAPRERLTSPFRGLGFLVIGAVAILFLSGKRK